MGGGECGGDGGGVGQGKGEGWSHSGARVADDSSVSSECHSGCFSCEEEVWRERLPGPQRGLGSTSANGYPTSLSGQTA